jgi:hypothetical protein
MNARKIIAGLAISATALIGTAGVAFAADGASHPAKQARIEQACAKAPTLEQKMNDNKTKVQDRITKLTAAKAKADAAGKTELSDKISSRIDKLNDRLTKIDTRLAKVTTWVAAHCSTPAQG